MKLNTYSLLLLTSLIGIDAADKDIGSFHKSKVLTQQDFSRIFHRAITDENDVTLQHLHTNGRQLRHHDENIVWDGLMRHGWTAAKYPLENRSLRSENDIFQQGSVEKVDEQEIRHPFLLCSSYPNQSGYIRLQKILTTFNTTMPNVQTVYNTEETSCFVVVTTSDAVEEAFGESYLQTGESRDRRMAHVTFCPIVDVLKFAAGTPSSIVADEHWEQPTVVAKPSLRRGTINSKKEQQYWMRSFMVDLIPGSLSNADNQNTKAMSQDIIDSVSAMANVKPMPIKAINSTKASMLRNSNIMSTRDAFSLTSRNNGFDSIKTRSSNDIWSNALEKGFESDHGCNSMFDLLEIRPRVSMKSNETDIYDDSISVIGFELILNAPQTTDRQILDSSALNKQCVLSLIIGLSVHNLVQTIEIAQPLELASISSNSNPQWITQTASLNSRPFFDNGLDGSGQVVAVADGGLDRDNCYFRDANADDQSIFRGSWDMSARKVVHYDDTFADRDEIYMGHGTSVSGIIAGKKSTNGIDDEVGYADGVAPGSKLSFFDMEVGGAGIQDPGVSTLFSSFYNSGKGAKVMNGSWGRSYNGVYTSFCRDYDRLLRSNYPDVLFVVSAGNTGTGSIESSMQNPADCKNVLGVGASLSHGKDIRSKDKGFEYLAEYSSRGPSADGRIKPDLVAPGHFIFAPNADPSRIGECDGTSSPNVQYSLSAGKGGHYVTGTSMSSPIVAGSASIVRQYFEEGWCNEDSCCGYKGCGVSLNPSGSLLKAILMNGAQPLTGGVQRVPDGPVLQEPLVEYDNNQGYGRLNLLNSLPLSGENDIQLIAVNDKGIRNEEEQEYIVDIDTSNGCNSDLRVTLAWYDPPGSVGCTNCLMNDLDLYIEEVDGTETYFPNGLMRRDKKNTVERIRMQPLDGMQYRIVVHAENFATNFQRYSLAISGCFRTAEPSVVASVSPQIQTLEVSHSEFTKTIVSCSNSEMFEFELVAAEGENEMKWDLIMPNPDTKSSDVVISSPVASEYESNKIYHYSACLQPNRYRFKILNIGDASYKIFIGGEEIVNSQSLNHQDDLYSFRFRMTERGYSPITRTGTRPTHVV